MEGAEMADWKLLLNNKRRKPKAQSGEGSFPALAGPEVRTEFERDYDRILFSTPVRRLADKTQVFPLERIDSVRTRLTHSHEAANLARSIGVNLAFDHDLVGDDDLAPKRNVPSLLAAVGLAHDLGNPPFGHQGEAAIQAWFQKRKTELWGQSRDLTNAMKEDFLRFEGNAQTLRLVTRLQIRDDIYGLNLTYGTLAALMKYPVPSDEIDESSVCRKKHGFFQSEADIVQDVWNNTGLSKGQRHPLTYVMEACDDIAYSVLDAEDAVKKGLVSFPDLLAHLRHHSGDDAVVNEVCDVAEHDHTKYRDLPLSPAELNDLSMQKFRVHSIAVMVRDATQAFLKNEEALMGGKFEKALVNISNSGVLYETLKNFDREHAYKHRSVLEVELTGFNTLHALMNLLWIGISDRKDPEDPASRRNSPFAVYAYGRISENYRRVFESRENRMPIRYKEAQLLTDMVSGMTDSFAISLCEDLRKYHVSGS
jgi:dGTPase